MLARAQFMHGLHIIMCNTSYNVYFYKMVIVRIGTVCVSVTYLTLCEHVYIESWVSPETCSIALLLFVA